MNVAFTVLLWSIITRHAGGGLPRPDPPPELEAPQLSSARKQPKELGASSLNTHSQSDDYSPSVILEFCSGLSCKDGQLLGPLEKAS